MSFGSPLVIQTELGPDRSLAAFHIISGISLKKQGDAYNGGSITASQLKRCFYTDHSIRFIRQLLMYVRLSENATFGA